MNRARLGSTMLAGLLAFLIICNTFAVASTTHPATSPAAGVDLSSPSTVYAAALAAQAAGDKQKLISLYDYPPDINPELVDARAQEEIDHYQIVRELQKRFPGEHATFPGGRPMSTPQTDPLPPLPVEAWRIEGDVALPSRLPGMSGAPTKVFRDGGWRIRQFNVGPAFHEIEGRMLQSMRRRISLEQEALRELLAGQFKTIDDFLDAEEPTRAEFRQRHAEAIKQTEAFFNQKSDTTTINGFSEALMRDNEKPDVLATYLYIPGDDGSYARARIQYSIALTHFFTMSDTTDPLQKTAVEYGLVQPANNLNNTIMWHWKEQGDTALPTDDQWAQDMIPSLRKVDGHWKIDLSREAGPDLDQRTKDMIQDTAKINDIVQQITSRKLSNPDQLRAAFEAAKLHSPNKSRNFKPAPTTNTVG